MTDLVLAALLLAGAVIGAVRGLFKSLMGLGVLIAALVGAVLLANILTDPITDIAAPKVEDTIVRQCAELTEEIMKEGSDKATAARDELLKKYVIREDWQKELEHLMDFNYESSEQTRKQVEQMIRGKVSDGVRKAVHGTVHAILLLVLYAVLTVALKLAIRALDHVFDLPVLNTLNTVGGAVLGLLEAALLLVVLTRAANALGVEAIAAHADEGVLLPLFLGGSAAEGLPSLSR